ncbi:MAG TPA: beta-propeller fold lactonase family protein [Candidatus Angelobacter sp.]|nr:beta-propeller fold lactonase family protein [Candidatus Angelobacter sp.]
MISPAHRFSCRPIGAPFVIFAALFASVLMALAGCNGMMGNPLMGPAQSTAFAFISNSGAGTVSAFAISSTGGLSAVSGSPFPAGSGAEFMAFDAIHKLLFVSNQSANSVSEFSVNTASGALTAVAGSPAATGARPTAIAVDPAGRFLFVAQQAANSIAVFSIGSGGALAPIAGSPFPAANPFGLAVNPAGAVLFASNFPDSSVSDLNSVSAFSIAANGALTPISGSPFADANSSAGFAATIGILADPSGKFLFAADHMAESVVSFNVNATTSALSPVSALPTPASSCGTSCHHNPLRLAVDPADKFIYWTNVQNGTVSAFNINNGNLLPVAETPTGTHPFGLALDPTGQFLYVINKADNTIAGFSVNSASGMLTALRGFPVAEGSSAPTDIIIVGKTM